MLLNHLRRTPGDWNDAVPSLCPDCDEQLTARRGPVVVWHWAHRPTGFVLVGGCGSPETHWHLTWKSVYHDFPGWEVEVPYKVGKEKFRLDAARLDKGLVREFVHSLSNSYTSKHLALKQSGLDVLWIFDGDEFGAARCRDVRGGGLKHLLKPRAYWLHSQIGGLVHHEGELWHEWRDNVWYPARGTAASLARAFDEKRKARNDGKTIDTATATR